MQAHLDRHADRKTMCCPALNRFTSTLEIVAHEKEQVHRVQTRQSEKMFITQCGTTLIEDLRRFVLLFSGYIPLGVCP